MSTEEILENIIDNRDILEGKTQLLENLTHEMEKLKTHLLNKEVKDYDDSQKYENDCNCEQSYDDEYANEDEYAENSEEYEQNEQCDCQQTEENDDEKKSSRI